MEGGPKRNKTVQFLLPSNRIPLDFFHLPTLQFTCNLGLRIQVIMAKINYFNSINIFNPGKDSKYDVTSEN